MRDGTRSLILIKNNDEQHAFSFDTCRIKRIAGLGTTFTAEDYSIHDGFFMEVDKKHDAEEIVIDVLFTEKFLHENFVLANWLTADVTSLKIKYSYEYLVAGSIGYRTTCYRDVSLSYYSHDDQQADGSGSATICLKCLSPWYSDVDYTYSSGPVQHITQYADRCAVKARFIVSEAGNQSIALLFEDDHHYLFAAVSASYEFSTGDVVEYSSFPNDSYFRIQRVNTQMMRVEYIDLLPWINQLFTSPVFFIISQPFYFSVNVVESRVAVSYTVRRYSSNIIQGGIKIPWPLIPPNAGGETA